MYHDGDFCKQQARVQRRWLRYCVRSRQKPRCNEDEAFIEAVTFILSVEAYKQGRKVRWDAAKQEIV